MLTSWIPLFAASLLLSDYPEIRGAAMNDTRTTLYTWGPQGLYESDTSAWQPRLVARGPYSSRGGCWTPTFGMVLAGDAPRRLMTSQKLGWIDSGVHLADCLEATLFGQPGILLIHRNAQIRFYTPPDQKGERWPYQEIYSIYTPSAQTGLLLEDIDGDGRVDLYCGNYWVHSPEAMDLSWRLFAIHMHYKQPLSSSFRLAKAFGGVVAAQREFDDKPVFSLFRKPGDPKQLWAEEPLAPEAKIRRPQALLAMRGGSLIVVGEDAGPSSRILVLRSAKDGGTVLARPGAGVIAAFEGHVPGTIVAILRNRVMVYSLPADAPAQ